MHRVFRNYFKRVKASQKRVSCPSCQQVLLPKDFEDHCKTQHGLNPMLSCVWCMGKKTWRKGEKSQNVDHLSECFKSLMVLSAVRNSSASVSASTSASTAVSTTSSSPPATPDTYDPMDVTPTCEARDFFGHPRLVSERAYQHFLPTPLNPVALPYVPVPLNLAASCVQKYLQSEVDFYHVMVRAVAMDSFLRAVDAAAAKGQDISFLPFFCWCAGGKYDERRYNHHRHMIAVYTPRGGFARYFNRKVTSDDVPCENYPCILKKKITSALHLVNVILYLSNPESQCRFSFHNDDEGERVPGNKRMHYYIWNNLPSREGTRIALSRLWQNGLMQVLHQKYNRMKIREMSLLPFQRVDNQWRLPIRDLPGLKMNLVLPVSRRFVPCTEYTEYYFHLDGSRKLFFRPSQENLLDDREWLQRQGDGGHSIYRVMSNAWWTPGPVKQACLDCILPVYRRDRNLEGELPSLQREFAEKDRADGAKIDEEREDLKKENVELKKRILDLTMEILDLKTENFNLKTEKSNLLIENLKMENANLKREMMLKEENELKFK